MFLCTYRPKAMQGCPDIRFGQGGRLVSRQQRRVLSRWLLQGRALLVFLHIYQRVDLRGCLGVVLFEDDLLQLCRGHSV
jgi:hypothetical protein